MIGAGLLLLVEAAAASGGACIVAGEVEGGAHAWFRNGEEITFENKTFVKYGLPREGIAEYVEVVGTKDGVPITAEKGVREREVIYLLAHKSECSFQPYQVKPN